MTIHRLKTGPRPSDKWIPWYLAFFFIVMVAALAPMAYMAVHTLPGVVTENSYEKGLAYNSAIAEGAKQSTLGWRGEISITSQGGQETATYRLVDGAEAPIDGAAVKLFMVRPTQSGMDSETRLEPTSPGIYTAPVILAAKGVWDARVSVDSSLGRFQTETRVVIP